MADMMAVISKAVFEKMTKTAKVGDVLAMDRYSSGNPALGRLGEDGARLFLFTVRPPDEKLWLVGVLGGLEFDGSAWVGEANTTPITDVGKLKSQIKFESGVGITAKPGSLGMSLQTPRGLTEADVALLLGAAGGKKGAAAPAPAPAPAKAKAKAQADEGEADEADEGDDDGEGGGKLVFTPVLRPKTAADIKGVHRKQFEALEELEHDDEETISCMDFLDIHDEKGKLVYQMAIFCRDDGAVFEANSTEMVAQFSQGGLAQCDDEDVGKRLEAGYGDAWKKKASAKPAAAKKTAAPAKGKVKAKAPKKK
jgi:hypothetical protein